MPHTDPPRMPHQALWTKLAAVTGLTGCFLLIEWASSYSFLTSVLPVPPSVSATLLRYLEHAIWQFGVGMLVITLLSRGHLWSYGINSSDIRLSMSILLKFYGVAVGAALVGVVLPLFSSASIPAYLQRAGRIDMAGWIVFEWMAAAVADEIFFHGLVQTVLLKFWKNEIAVGPFKIPLVVLVAAIGFAAGRSNVIVYVNTVVDFFLALGIGVYGGLVYHRTRSLLTPMLSQAFFYGLPFLIRFVYLSFRTV